MRASAAGGGVPRFRNLSSSAPKAALGCRGREVDGSGGRIEGFLSFTQIWNLEPHMRAMLEEDRHWVAANARYLAKVALEGYRGALEAA